MKRFIAVIRALVCLSLLMPAATAQKTTPSPVLQALDEELKRAFDLLKQKGDPAPYFIGYSVNEVESVDIDASLGALRSSQTSRTRLLDVDVRVGDYQLDNTHQIRGQRVTSGPSFSYPVLMPVDDDVDALKSVVWLETDQKYKGAVERFIQVKANRAIKVEEEDTSADLSRESKQIAVLPAAKQDLDISAWEKKVQEFSASFNKYPEIYEGAVGISSNATNDYLANTEGTTVQHGIASVRLSIYARTKADDGMELYRFESFDAHSADGLPGDAAIRQTIETMVRDLKALRAAPVIEPYTGPAILSGRASGVFFHEIFGHRIEGHRQKNEAEGQTFTKKINQPVLPDFISVIDDPTMERISGTDLNGYYAFDDDGVAAQRVTVVDKGVLKNFLMSRSPVAGFENSNGHGRKAPGFRTVGRQGNLIVQATSTVSDSKMRAMLIERAQTSLRVAKQDEIQAEQAHAQRCAVRHFDLFGKTRGDPVAAHHPAHRRVAFHAAQQVVFLGGHHRHLRSGSAAANANRSGPPRILRCLSIAPKPRRRRDRRRGRRGVRWARRIGTRRAPAMAARNTCRARRAGDRAGIAPAPSRYAGARRGTRVSTQAGRLRPRRRTCRARADRP